jgi:hypothetical protein
LVGTPEKHVAKLYEREAVRWGEVPGVVAIAWEPGDEVIRVVACAPHIKERLGLDVSEAALVSMETIDSLGDERCDGCFFEGRYYGVDERYKIACNHCTCSGFSQVRCTLLGCLDTFLTTIEFSSHQSDLDRQARVALANVIDLMREDREVALNIIGMRSPDEDEALGGERARVVLDHLVKEGVARQRLFLHVHPSQPHDPAPVVILETSR